MSEPSDKSEMFRMNLAWEDEDEVVVKLEPVDSPIVPRVGRARDLVPNEEWTRDGDIRRRSYTNKRRLIPTEVKEITFRVEDPAEIDEEILPTSEPSLSVVAERSNIPLRKEIRSIDKSKGFDNPAGGVISPIISSVPVHVKESSGPKIAQKIQTPKTDGKQSAVSTRQHVHIPARGIVSPKKSGAVIVPVHQEKLKNVSISTPAEVKRGGEHTTRNKPCDTDKSTNKPASLETIAKPRIVALLRNKTSVQHPSAKVIYLTPVPKEVVMRSKSAIRVLPEMVSSEPAPSPKLPIYLRKIPDSLTPNKSKSVSLLQADESYTGIYSSNTEPMTRGKKQAAHEMKDRAPLQSARRARGRGAARKQRELAGISYTCYVCDLVFDEKKQLYEHSKHHAFEKRAPRKPCLDCGKLFVDNTQLRIHSRVHTGETPYSCSVCEKTFKHQTSLTRHYMHHTKERPHACDICTKTYRNKFDLNNHKRVHTDERPYACKFCDKRFNDRCAKNTHERIHSDKKYKCPVCLRGFAQSTTLRGHMVTHSEERPFSCVLCDMKFKSKVVLRSHERVHTAGRTFKCEFCNLLFTEKRTLARHSYTHKEKPFPCSFCKRWYFREERYLAHLETHNAKDRPFKCRDCHKCYANEGYLKLHTLKAHGLEARKGKEYTCKSKACGQTFSNLILLTRHMLVHGDIFVLECDICKKRFAKKKTLQMHMIKAHKFADYYMCGKCDKTFIRKTVLIKHISVKCS